jgi:hypothetical protein
VAGSARRVQGSRGRRKQQRETSAKRRLSLGRTLRPSGRRRGAHGPPRVGLDGCACHKRRCLGDRGEGAVADG